MSAISYLKAPAYQNGHPEYSDPIDEQDEDNWGLGRMGNQSFDVKAGPINNMFDFSRTGHRAGNLLSNPTHWNAKCYWTEVTPTSSLLFFVRREYYFVYAIASTYSWR